MRILIVDDENASRYLLKQLLKGIGLKTEFREAASAEEAYQEVINNRPDIIFLDIELNGKNGFDFLDMIKDMSRSITIVFVTGFSNYAIQAIKNNAFDYIMKPVNPEELKKTITRFQVHKEENDQTERLNNLLKSISNHNKVKFSTSSGILILDPAEILLLEAEGNYSKIFIKDKKAELVSNSLAKAEKILDLEQFMRISRSTIINLNFLSKIDKRNKNCLIQNGDQELNVRYSKHIIKILEERFKG